MPPGETATDDGVGMVSTNPDTDVAEGGNRRRLLILGAVAGVIVLAAAAYLLLHKGSSSPSTPALVPHGVVSSAPATSGGGQSGQKHHGTKSLPKVTKHQVAKDPFVPLIVPPVTTTGAPVSTTTVPASTAPSTAPSSGTSPNPNPSQPTSTGGGPKSATTPEWIQLMSTSGQTATFKVGYPKHKFRLFKVQAPKANSDQGTVFGKVFALIAIQHGEATVQIGDGAPFILTEGVAHTA
jgi:hypothetical protein